jgi:hypothetical protein
MYSASGDISLLDGRLMQGEARFKTLFVSWKQQKEMHCYSASILFEGGEVPKLFPRSQCESVALLMEAFKNNLCFRTNLFIHIKKRFGLFRIEIMLVCGRMRFKEDIGRV